MSFSAFGAVPVKDQPVICQPSLPLLPWMEPAHARLPGTVPIRMEQWLCRDAVFGAQMALRDRLLREKPAKVMAQLPEAADALAETMALVRAWLETAPGYEVSRDAVGRPDGKQIATDGAVLPALGRLVQEDLLVHLPRNDTYFLAGGVLCFPASWSLEEKLGRDLAAIHAPVAAYDANIARRVGRLFDGLRAGRPLMRANWLGYATHDLYQPRSEAAPRTEKAATFMRVERQCLLRLPESGAVLFSIHTFVVPIKALPATARGALEGRE